ncbi:hypothetical protein [Propionivibrio sp.]|uniref:hypothetical protein n=1 Tax=Propionivibrio sp. TaxID=2212460 RepID=UPI0026009A6B|nr:hypothetical protein [Propionivibrio sp.]MBK7357422.1 AbrB/MazE/SpoVT family DNA-binding domain-containing protein [Propionivibrio sp.]
MLAERHVERFRNGSSQALLIPREFELPRNAAKLEKDGVRLTIDCVKAHNLIGLLATRKPINGLK